MLYRIAKICNIFTQLLGKASALSPIISEISIRIISRIQLNISEVSSVCLLVMCVKNAHTLSGHNSNAMYVFQQDSQIRVVVLVSKHLFSVQIIFPQSSLVKYNFSRLHLNGDYARMYLSYYYGILFFSQPQQKSNNLPSDSNIPSLPRPPPPA